MNKISCRICFTSDKLKLLSMFSVKIDEKSLAEMVNYLAGTEVSLQNN